MFSAYTKVHPLLASMLFSGIILVPTALATPAVQDLTDMRTIVNAAASTIGDPNNPNRGFGFNILGGGGMGTADLVNNITNSVLRMQFQVNTNMTAWLLPSNATLPGLNTTTPTPAAPTPTLPTPAPLPPTLPLSSSVVLPSALPSGLANATTDLSTPYIDYVSAIPNLATSLTTLGRAYHREMNSAVYQAVMGLQQSLTTLQTTMLQNNLIGSQAILRTIRASSSLENSKTAWSRFLNLPGSGSTGNTGGSSGTGTGSDSGDSGSGDSGSGVTRRALLRPPPADGTYYTHKELWERDGRRRASTYEELSRSEVVAQWGERRARVVNVGAENARMGRLFVG